MTMKRLISALSDDEHEEFRKKIRKFAVETVRPAAEKIERNAEFPHQIVDAMAAKGWMGIPIPIQYGGAGLDTLSYIIAVEELARVSGSLAITLAAHTSLVVWPIYINGNESQKEKYLKPLASGKHLGSFGLTENNAGSDAAATETTAILENGTYLINGSKRFITNATYADTLIFTATEDRSLGVKGISAFIVEKGTTGYQVVRKENKLGLRASDTAELIFDSCRLPAENLLGKSHEGFKVFMETLDGGRISIGALALGEAQGALDSVTAFIVKQGLHGDQLIQKNLADMQTEVSASRHMIYHAARLKDGKLRVNIEGAMAKLYASEVCMRVTAKALDIMGLEGLNPSNPAERFFRDAKLNEIGEGTSEIQRIVIARQLIKDFSENTAGLSIQS